MNQDKYKENIKRNLKKLNNDDFETLRKIINSLYLKKELNNRKEDEN